MLEGLTDLDFFRIHLNIIIWQMYQIKSQLLKHLAELREDPYNAVKIRLIKEWLKFIIV